TAGAAAMAITLSDDPQPKVVAINTGQRGGPPLLESADGRAEVVRTGDAFEVTGALVHTQHSQNAAAGTEEEFTASFTCKDYATG
ncbi:MAG: lipoprotein LpqH, partial [Propionibacteriaceae bacterium]|nr:lipoprotein LpqH [Propionibacteriaceae bacterium]